MASKFPLDTEVSKSSFKASGLSGSSTNPRAQSLEGNFRVTVGAVSKDEGGDTTIP